MPDYRRPGNPRRQRRTPALLQRREVTMLTHNAPVMPDREQLRARALSAAGGVLAAVAVWIIEVPLIGIGLSIRFGSGQPQTIGIGPVIGVSLAASLLAWLLLAILDKRTPRARAAWISAALVVLAVSLALPLTAATTTAATTGLILLHAAVAAVVIPSMARTTRARR
jgi:hypothetical protein